MKKYYYHLSYVALYKENNDINSLNIGSATAVMPAKLTRESLNNIHKDIAQQLGFDVTIFNIVRLEKVKRRK